MRQRSLQLLLILLFGSWLPGQAPAPVAQWEKLGQARMNAGDLAGAEEAFRQALETKPESIRLLRVLSGLALKRGDEQQAWQWLAEARRLAPNSPTVVAEFAEIAMIRGYFAEALTAARLLLLLDPEEGEYLYLLGRALFQNSSFSKAVEVFTSYLSENPDQPAARMILGASLYHEGDYPSAREQLTRARESGADVTETDYYLGMVAYSRGEDERSQRLLEDALERSPEHGRARLGLAKVLFRQGRLEAAFVELEQAALLLPEEPDVFFQMSRVLSRLDRREEARQALERYRELKVEQEKRFTRANSLPFTTGGTSVENQP